MKQTADLRLVLAAEMARLQPAPGLESRILESMRQHPASANGRWPGRDTDGWYRKWTFESRLRSPRAVALVAALLALAIVVTLVFTAQALHVTRSVPVNPPRPRHVAPLSGSSLVVHSVSLQAGTGGIYMTQPVPLQPPAINPCQAEAARYGCMAATTPVFSTPSVGWTTAGAFAPEGPINLYRTDDDARHWHTVLGWDYRGASEIKSSPDGRELLIITAWAWQGPALFHSSDGGDTWKSMGFPLTAAQASAVSQGTVTNCKGPGFLCSRDPAYFPQGEIYFRDPLEGWILTQEPSYGVANLFHTSDSGAHWSLAARIDIKNQFGLDLTAGQTSSTKGGGSYLDHTLRGQIVFQSSAVGWFVPEFGASRPFMYRTADGGKTWGIQNLDLAPDTVSANAVAEWKFFNDRNAVLDLVYWPKNYLYTTGDGGASWSPPVLIPISGYGPAFFDLQNWIGWGRDGSLQRTTDGGIHWETVVPKSSVNGASGGTLAFVDSLHGLSVTVSFGGRGIFETSDGGVSWVELTLPQSG